MDLFWMMAIDGGVDSHAALLDLKESYLKDAAVNDADHLLAFSRNLLHLFIQHNFTGPPLFTCASEKRDIIGKELDIKCGFLNDSSPIADFIDSMDASASKILELEGGEDLIPLVHFSCFLLISQWIFELCHDHLWISRSLFVHQRVSSFAAERLRDRLLESIRQIPVKEQDSQFLVFQALVWQYYGLNKKASECLDAAEVACNFRWNITGRMGKRTKFQQFDIAQLTLETSASTAVDTATLLSGSTPHTLPLEDDTLLDRVQFSNASNSSQDIGPVEQCILLSRCLNVKNSGAMDDEITYEQMMPFLERVIERPNNFSIHTVALYSRAVLDGSKRRKFERSLMQIQALVDQFPITDSGVGGASFEVRVSMFWAMMMPMKIEMQAQLAKLYLEYGMTKSSLELYESLERWEEVIHCHIMMEEHQKAEKRINELLDRADSPHAKLYCILGDLKKDQSYYEKAWELSNCRSSRAARALGAFYFRKGMLKESMEFYEKALSINSLFENAWFAYGCAAMQLEEWEKARLAFLRCIQMESKNAEAWNNLAAIDIKLGRKADAFRCLQEGLKERRESWKMWENLLFLALDLKKFSDAIEAVTCLLESKWKDKNSVDTNAIDVLVLGALGQHSVSETKEELAINVRALERLQNMLITACEMHVSLGALWMVLARIHEHFDNLPGTIDALEAALRASDPQTDLIYNLAEFEKLCPVVFALASAYIVASKTDKMDDGKYKAKLLLRKMMKRSKETFEGHKMLEELQQKLEETAQ